MVRDTKPLATAPARSDRGFGVERVGPEGAAEWADFLQRVYRLEAGPWLPALIGRPGWRQDVAREDGQGVGARGMFLRPGGLGWLGVDGPRSGGAAGGHEPDGRVCAPIL